MMEKVYDLEDASEILPMWVADMDFPVPEAVINAIKNRLKHPVFGYSYEGDDCKKSIINWLARRHNWSVSSDSILFHQGVIPAIASILETFTNAGDKVCISTPVYAPFSKVPKNQNREVIECKLIEKEGSYAYDFDELENCFKSGVKVYILCNPHNPAGIVWRKDDLKEIIRLCIKYNVLLLSDEIHGDIIIDGNQHVPIMTVDGAENARIISCIAPTKTFNLASIQAAMMIVPNDELRLQLSKHAQAHGYIGLSAISAVAIKAAYEHGDVWLDELLIYISKNMDYVMENLNVLEGIRTFKPQGTYLMWIDYRETGLSEKEMMKRLLEIGKLALEPGSKFGEAGKGFLRINVACSFETIQDGVQRFKQALL